MNDKLEEECILRAKCKSCETVQTAFWFKEFCVKCGEYDWEDWFKYKQMYQLRAIPNGKSSIELESQSGEGQSPKI